MGLKNIQFEFSIGGYPGPFYQLYCQDEILICEGRTADQESVEVWDFNLAGNENWQAMMQFLQSRKWKETYIDEGILDGSNWSLNLTAAQISISSSGSNAYPPGFKKFLKLLNAVTAEKSLVIY